VRALVIARFTIQEAISRRLVLAGLLLSLAFVGLFALGYSFLFARMLDLQSHRLEEPGPNIPIFGSLMTVMGLYAVHFLSGFLALFLSVGAVAGEIESGTLHAILARPIRRAELVLGRWLAYAGMMGVYVALMAGLLLLVARLLSGYEAPDSARTIGLMALGSILLMTVSLLGSTLLSTLANGVVVFTLFGLSWLGGIIEFIGGAVPDRAMVNLGIAVSLLMPSDAIWRAASFYVQSPAFTAMAASRSPIPFVSVDPPTPAFLLWSLGYGVLALAGAVLAFSRRDL
jgi:ABC-type transport system involved in multi-copper enzyme maturation permease subunit